MSLDWDITEVEDYQNVCWIPDGEEFRLNPITDALIWLSITTSIGTITEENWKDVYRRIWLDEKLHGARLREGSDPRPITPEDVFKHIGLRTNVYSKETERQFAWRLYEQAVQKADAKLSAFEKENG